ncbi:unnamed protein product [Sympodiomycopsis kandeliae]
MYTTPAMRSSNAFLDLPIELHLYLAHFLSADSLFALAAANRKANVLYRDNASARVRLDGVQELAGFQDRLTPRSKRSSCMSVNSQPSKRQRHQIREMEMYDLKPSDNRGYSDFDDMEHSNSPERATMIGKTLSVCPKLTTLRILQSSLPLSPIVAHAIAASVPHLQSLTFQSPHCDANSLAMLLRELGSLHTLDVSSVKTCSCRGSKGQTEGVVDFAVALSSHKRLRRVVFNSCKALGWDNGLLLRVLSGEEHQVCEQHRIRLRHEHQVLELLKQYRSAYRQIHHQPSSDQSQTQSQSPHHHHHHHNHHHKSSFPKQQHREGCDGKPVRGALRLKSIEFRRSPLHGRALMRYLRSEPASSLTHLFVGGCKQVRPGHLVLATQCPDHHHGICSSREALHLEVDGRLLSKELLRNLSHRITTLRIFEPSELQISLLVHVLRTGGLQRLANLIILPSEEDVARWSSLPADEVQAVSGPRSTDGPLVIDGDLRADLERRLSELERCVEIDLTIGDEAWHAMQDSKEAMRYWAQMQKEEEEAEQRKRLTDPAVTTGQGYAKGGEPNGFWMGGGIDVWR